MKSLKIISFCLAVASVLIYPLVVRAFSYNSPTIGINFSGDAIFTGLPLLYPGANVCKDVIFSNSSSATQPLGFASTGFNTSGMFDYFEMSVKDASQTYVNKPVENFSTNVNNPEVITDLTAGENKIITFCINVSDSMGNDWQGKTAGPVSFTFGFSGQETASSVPVFGGATTPITTGGTVSGVTTPTTTATTTPSTTPTKAEGTVAGEETNNQNMCCEWVWWNLIPWILVAILLIWLMWMWSKDRNRRDKENI